MDTPQTITHVSLCAGYGGIDFGLKRAIPDLRTIAFSEIEGYACANLVAKMEAGLLDAAPIWTDLKTFPWSEFSGKVDIMSGGYPCQPFSAAGKRLGKEDPRHLWPFIADGVRAMRPRICFFENVEGHISLGLREVISELESIGYKAAWGIFSAREVGAPHQRKRVFILAHRIGEGLEGFCGHESDRDEPGRQRADTGGSTGASGLWRRVSFACDCEGYDEETGDFGNECSICGLTYADDCQCPGPTQDGFEYEERDGVLYARSERQAHAWPSRPGEPQHGWEPPRVVGNAEDRSNRQHSTEQQGRSAFIRPSDEEPVGNAKSRNGFRTTSRDPRHVAQPDESMGNASRELLNGSGSSARENRCAKPANAGQWQAQPSLGRDPYGSASRLDYAELCVTCDNRTDELRLLGNGVVPATATRAFLILLEELNESPSLPTSSS